MFVNLGTKGEESSSESEASENNENMSSPDESELFVEETEDAVYVGPIRPRLVVEEREDVVFVGLFTPTKPPPPSAETILFSVEEEEGSSEEEESDWIVSSEDDEEEIEDLMEVLAQLRKPQPIKQPPMNYPFEPVCKETMFEVMEDQEEGDGAAEQEMQLSLHQVLKECREMGEEESEGEGKDEGREEEIQKEREREEGKGEGERKDEQESRRKEAEKRSTAATKLKQLLPKLKDRLEDVDSRGNLFVILFCFVLLMSHVFINSLVPSPTPSFSPSFQCLTLKSWKWAWSSVGIHFCIIYTSGKITKEWKSGAALPFSL